MTSERPANAQPDIQVTNFTESYQKVRINVDGVRLYFTGEAERVVEQVPDVTELPVTQTQIDDQIAVTHESIAITRQNSRNETIVTRTFSGLLASASVVGVVGYEVATPEGPSRPSEVALTALGVGLIALGEWSNKKQKRRAGWRLERHHEKLAALDSLRSRVVVQEPSQGEQ